MVAGTQFVDKDGYKIRCGCVPYRVAPDGQMQVMVVSSGTYADRWVASSLPYASSAAEHFGGRFCRRVLWRTGSSMICRRWQSVRLRKRQGRLAQYAGPPRLSRNSSVGQVEYPELAVLRDEKKKSLTM